MMYTKLALAHIIVHWFCCMLYVDISNDKIDEKTFRALVCTIRIQLLQLLFAVGIDVFSSPHVPTDPERTLFEEGVCVFVCLGVFSDILFYHLHRFVFHSNETIYVWFHKQHHKWTHDTHAFATLDCSFVEHFGLNLPSLLLPLWFFEVSSFGHMVAIVLATVHSTLFAHGDSDTLHRIHHEKQTVNFGTGLHFMDRLWATFR